MHLNKNHTFSRRALAMLLTLTLCLSLVPSAFAAQQNSYHDPAEHWMQASNRTNELDVNSVVTRETFKCGECGKVSVHVSGANAGMGAGRPEAGVYLCSAAGRCGKEH